VILNGIDGLDRNRSRDLQFLRSSKCGKSTAACWGVVATKKITTKPGACCFLAALAARVHTTC
jgi:hypothetical protein